MCRKFDIPYTMELKNIGDELTGEYLSLELTDTRSNVKVLPTDVGFGISQLLPILIEGVTAQFERVGSIICVEQPEIHLHPRLQAMLGDFFIETITNVSEKKRKRNSTQWIIETHSETLMYRLQRGIRDGAITNKDISVLYVEPRGKKGASVSELRLDENGEFIDIWPDGFFVENLYEILDGGKQ
jgi:predicted ATPase